MSVAAGKGGYCAYCHKRIDVDAVEYEVEAYVAAGLRSFHFHRVCLHLWEELTSQGSTDLDAKAEDRRAYARRRL